MLNIFQNLYVSVDEDFLSADDICTKFEAFTLFIRSDLHAPQPYSNHCRGLNAVSLGTASSDLQEGVRRGHILVIDLAFTLFLSARPHQPSQKVCVRLFPVTSSK